jgi:cobalt-zinc-cadmium efflux system protein
VVSIVLQFVDFPILDPILAVLITVFVLWQVVGKLRSTLSLFLQGVPPELDMAALQGRLLAIEGVRSAHYTHVWSLDGEHHVLTTHLVMGEDATRADTLRAKNAVTELSSQLGMEHTTVEIEYDEEDCSMNGNGCA